MGSIRCSYRWCQVCLLRGPKYICTYCVCEYNCTEQLSTKVCLECHCILARELQLHVYWTEICKCTCTYWRSVRACILISISKCMFLYWGCVSAHVLTGKLQMLSFCISSCCKCTCKYGGSVSASVLTGWLCHSGGEVDKRVNQWLAITHRHFPQSYWKEKLDHISICTGRHGIHQLNQSKNYTIYWNKNNYRYYNDQRQHHKLYIQEFFYYSP